MGKEYTITSATVDDAYDLALLHKTGIPTGFLSQQTPSFLSALYTYLIENEIVYVAKVNKKTIGFLACTLATDGLYKKFLKENIGLLILFLLKNIFSLKFIKKALETFLAPNKTAISNEDEELPELLSIVVSENFKGQGVGNLLLKAFEDNISSKTIIRYKVLVGSKLEANGFYVQNGFKLKKEVELHKGEISNIYVKILQKESYEN